MLCLAGFLHALAGLGGLAGLGVERELSEMILSVSLSLSLCLSLSLRTIFKWCRCLPTNCKSTQCTTYLVHQKEWITLAPLDLVLSLPRCVFVICLSVSLFPSVY